MLISVRDISRPAASEVTPEKVYRDRRRLLAAAGLAATGWPLLAAAPASAQRLPNAHGELAALPGKPSPLSTMERATSFEDATTYNNFYEFGTDKSDPARHAGSLQTRPWTVVVEGEVAKPTTFDIEALLKLAPQEERIYRMRCVEGWSMVIPWVGYPLAELIRQVEPTGNAKYIEFVTLAEPKQMPGLRSGVLGWPYLEGLRMDEAMHPLALLTFGMYGSVLPNQNGAPIRVTVPWKYGFYSNVNPNVDHPRWSQATERRIGEDGFLQRKRKTLMFNGYAEQVAQLYAGMDLRKHF